MKLPYRYILFIILISLVSSCAPKKKSVRKKKTKIAKKVVKKNLVDFYYGSSLSPVLDLAKKEGKPVYLYIHASWCLPCEIMDQEVYTHAPTAKFLNNNFINYSVDLDKENGPDLRIIYNASPLPTLLFLDHRGRVLERKHGATFTNDLKRIGQSALEKLKTQG